MIKKTIRLILNFFGLEIVPISKSPYSYFYKPRQIYFQHELEMVRESIYSDCPSDMYRESYHIHQIGSWGPIPSFINVYKNLNNQGEIYSLDIGCAFGTLAAFCSSIGYKACAVDFVPLEKYLGTKTKNNYGIDYRQISIESENIPWEPGKFSIITMSEVLEHFRYQPLATLEKIRVCLKPAGVLLITTPALGIHWKAEYYDCDFEQIPCYNGQFDNNPDKHWKIYSAKELDRLLNMAGFNATITLYLNINTGMENLFAVATKRDYV